MSTSFKYLKNKDKVTLQLRNGLTDDSVKEILKGEYDQIWCYFGNFENFKDIAVDFGSFKKLKIQSSEPQNIEWISDLENIEFLELRGKLKGKVDFSRLKQLTNCNMDWCPSTKNLPAANLPLETLGINRFSGKLTDFGQNTCNSLRVLGLTGSMDSLHGIQNFTFLEELSLWNMKKLLSINELSKCKKLKTLQIEGCNSIQDISSISEISSLEEIFYENRSLESLDLLPKERLRYIRLGTSTVIEDKNLEKALDFKNLEKFSFPKKAGYKYSAEEFDHILKDSKTLPDRPLSE